MLKLIIIIITTVKFTFRKKCRNVKLFILKLLIKYYIELSTMSKINKLIKRIINLFSCETHTKRWHTQMSIYVCKNNIGWNIKIQFKMSLNIKKVSSNMLWKCVTHIHL